MDIAGDTEKAAAQLKWRARAALTGAAIDVLAERIAGEWEVYATTERGPNQAVRALSLMATALVAAGVQRHAPAWWYPLRGRRDREVALAVADICMNAEARENSDSVVNVALNIGRELGIRGGLNRGEWDIQTGKGGTFSCGYRLIELAVEAGFLAADCLEAKREASKGVKYRVTRIRLSDKTIAERAQIEAELAKCTWLPERPYVERPPPIVSIRPNKRGPREPAPAPTGNAIVSALDAIQSTRWRVNAYMLNTLRLLAALDPQPLLPAEVAALEHAAVWQERPGFHFKQRFDFRGRVYARGRALQFTSANDFVRSLLEFNEPTPFNDDAQFALAKQICDCHPEAPSFRAASDFDEKCRVWLEAEAPELRKMVDDPPQHRLWLQAKAKKRYRFLASCEAWVRGERTGETHIPIVLDASCSGLQHAALLLRDEGLARHVNLWPGPKSDFYALVAARTGYNRDQVKRPVMTTFYGAGPDAIAEAIAWDERGSGAVLPEEFERAVIVQEACQFSHRRRGSSTSGSPGSPKPTPRRTKRSGCRSTGSCPTDSAAGKTTASWTARRTSQRSVADESRGTSRWYGRRKYARSKVSARDYRPT